MKHLYSFHAHWLLAANEKRRKTEQSPDGFHYLELPTIPLFSGRGADLRHAAAVVVVVVAHVLVASFCVITEGSLQSEAVPRESSVLVMTLTSQPLDPQNCCMIPELLGGGPTNHVPTRDGLSTVEVLNVLMCRSSDVVRE